NVNRITLERDGLGKPVDNASQAFKGVLELLPVGRLREAEAWQVGRDHVKAVGQGWNEITEHVRRRREAVQQKNGGSSFWSGFAIKNLQAVDGGMLISDHDGNLFRKIWPMARVGVQGSEPRLPFTSSDVLTDNMIHYRCYNYFRVAQRAPDQNQTEF